jgi:hypothetical protein
MKVENLDQIRELLNDLDFPASKQQILDHARSRGGQGTEAERALRALPVAGYASLQKAIHPNGRWCAGPAVVRGAGGPR